MGRQVSMVSILHDTGLRMGLRWEDRVGRPYAGQGPPYQSEPEQIQ